MGYPLNTFTAGDKVMADKNNDNFRKARDGRFELIAREAIDSSSGPIPFLISDNGWIYISDANDNDKARFDGFVVENQNVSAGEFVEVMMENGMIVQGFSGLTRGSDYYIQDTSGTIDTTPSTTNSIIVGTAINSTDIIIKKNPGIMTNTGSTTTRGQSTSDLSDTKSINTGFKPRYFEAIVTLGIVDGDVWSSGSNANGMVGAWLLKGIIGGTTVYFKTSYSFVAQPPNSVNTRNPYFDLETTGTSGSATHQRPSHSSGTTSSINVNVNAGGSFLYLASITATKNTLDFNFTSSQSGSNDDVRYGVKHIHIIE